jgi:hypothetical protein
LKEALFEFPSYRYKVSNWEHRKKELLDLNNKQVFNKEILGSFETNRVTADRDKDLTPENEEYTYYISEFLSPVISEFCREAKVSCSMTDAWCVKYGKGDFQSVHNHRGWGFSGILYVEFDSNIHSPTCFMAPWNDPRNDTTLLAFPEVEEGSVLISPSFSHHFVYPNESDKQRVVISFDLLPKQ